MTHEAGITTAREYFNQLQKVAARMPFAKIEEAIAALALACRKGHTVYLYGNGGSAALASHLACDLGKGVGHYSPGPRFRAISLVDNVSTMTAWANDSSYEDVFAEPLSNLVEPGDIAFAISGSGNSPNVLRALRVARAAGARTIGLTGFEGGRMKALCDICVVVPSDNMQIIEDLHLSIAHTVFTVIVNQRKNAVTAAAASAN